MNLVIRGPADRARHARFPVGLSRATCSRRRRPHGLDGKAIRLRLAVDEIATNVISHGYEEAG